MDVVLLQKNQKAILQILHLLRLILVEVHPYLHPVKRLPYVVRFRRYKPNPIYPLAPLEVLPQKVEHQRLVYLLVVLLASLNLEDQSAPVGIGLVFP